MGDIASAILRRYKPARGKDVEALRAAWAECVAPQYAKHCKVVSFSRGKLQIEVSSAAVQADIEGFLKHDILECLKQKCPDINVVALQFVQR